MKAPQASQLPNMAKKKDKQDDTTSWYITQPWPLFKPVLPKGLLTHLLLNEGLGITHLMLVRALSSSHFRHVLLFP